MARTRSTRPGQGAEGYYRMHRGWQENPAFLDEPFSRRDAWVWLIENAFWKPQRVNAAGKTISLDRGQMSYSVRFLAEQWGWDASKVSRFLSRLKADGMISTAADTGRTVITICNYNEYQGDERPVDTRCNTATTHHRDSSDTEQAGVYRLPKRFEAAKITDTEADAGYGAATHCNNDENPPNEMPVDTVRDTSSTRQRDSDDTNKKEGKKEKKYLGRAPAREDGLAFEGSVVRLTQDDYGRWCEAYRHIPDLRAELTKADAYYRDHPPRDGKWFFPVSRWLDRANSENAPPPVKPVSRGFRPSLLEFN